MPTVALVVISDRRDLYLPRCLESLEEFLPFPFSQRVILEDPEHRWTASGAVNEAWSRVEDDIEFVFSVEEDFVLTEPLDIEGMAFVLDAEPSLASLTLLRQPWSHPEVEAGGIIPLYGEHMIDRNTRGYPWTQHDRFFSLNPSLIPARTFRLGFTEGSEPANTQRLLNMGMTFGYWGHRSDPPRCLHVGEVRAAGSRR